jgi:DNA-binding transcriptional ArsR family regulator
LDPLWEVLLGMHMVQTEDAPEVFGAWRQRVRGRLTAVERELLVLAPPVGYSPDFLTPAESVDGLGAGLAAVAGTPPSRLRRELGILAEQHRLPRWTRRLAAGDPGVLAKVCHGLKHFHRTKIAPQLPAMIATISRDVRLHSDTVSAGGFASLAETLNPVLQWEPPCLRVDMGHIDRDLELGGRGLRLVPSYFCWRHPIMPADPTLPPVLVYPVEHDPALLEQPVDPERALAELLGRTRAAVLRTISAGSCSTSELAARAGISLASASEHARVLHRTGLVTTRRAGGAVRHTISPIGENILTGSNQ